MRSTSALSLHTGVQWVQRGGVQALRAVLCCAISGPGRHGCDPEKSGRLGQRNPSKAEQNQQGQRRRRRQAKRAGGRAGGRAGERWWAHRRRSSCRPSTAFASPMLSARLMRLSRSCRDGEAGRAREGRPWGRGREPGARSREGAPDDGRQAGRRADSRLRSHGSRPHPLSNLPAPRPPACPPPARPPAHATISPRFTAARLCVQSVSQHGSCSHRLPPTPSTPSSLSSPNEPLPPLSSLLHPPPACPHLSLPLMNLSLRFHPSTTQLQHALISLSSQLHYITSFN